MGLTPSLAADLALLTEAEDDSRPDLSDVIAVLGDDLVAAVPSYLGLAITIVTGGHRVTVTALVDDHRDDHVGSSVCLPLAPISAAEPGSQLVLYAARPGAFSDLAADVSWALGLPLDAAVIDRNLTRAAAQSGTSGLHELSSVNRALGVLVDTGHTPGGASDELHRLAALAGSTLLAAAVLIIEQAVLRRRD